MFTGIIEHVGRVRLVRVGSAGGVVAVDVGGLVDGTKLGDSIAVDGVCLTVTKIAGVVCDFDVSGETLSKSSLGGLKVGDSVNCERAMRADGRFGGHIVQGHVDGVGKVAAIERKGDFVEFRFTAGEDVMDEIIAKGSVAISGVSLTVAKIDAGGFSVAVIPATMRETTLAAMKVGGAINIETDIVVKTIKSQVAKLTGGAGGLTMDKLRGLGF
jgi:riboflavin synthase